jgi:hypothetical protein
LNGGWLKGRWMSWRLDFLWALCRTWSLWTAISDHNRVGVFIVVIVREDLEGVVVPC